MGVFFTADGSRAACSGSGDVYFRADVHALRACAVVAVIGFHWRWPGFSSGFVGIDIFFVISGFLITGQVAGALRQGVFRLGGFWLARFRRIAPALLALVAATLAAGWVLTPPSEYLRHVRQALYAATFGANIAFDKDRGYFEMAAQTKPLLHTWSLAVEWQFYLLLPLPMLLVWRFVTPARRTRWMIGVLAGLSALSLGWCLWVSATDAGSGFFSVRARAWEFLLGGLLALPVRPRPPPQWLRPTLARRLRRVAAPVGWGLVFASVTAGLPEKAWPGGWTLLPVLASLLVIAAGGVRGEGKSGRWVVLPGMQRIGDLSYSLYLWHWPLWVFALQWRPAEVPTLGGQLLLVAAVVLAAVSSYAFVEQPVRRLRHRWPARRLLAVSAASLAALAGFTMAAVATHGFPGRIPAYQQRAEAARRTNTPRDECFRNDRSVKSATAVYCGFGAPRGRLPELVLWGDSVANQYLLPLTAAAQGLGLHGLIATQSGCRALLVEASDTGTASTACERFNRQVLADVLAQSSPQIVVMGRNWADTAASAQEALAVAARLAAAGRAVVLILPSIHPGVDVPAHWMQLQMQAGRPIDTVTIPRTPEATLSTLRAEVVRHLGAVPAADARRIVLLDPLPQVCDEALCYLVREGQANFRDTLHISNLNAMAYAPLFSRALEEAVRAVEVSAAGGANSTDGAARHPSPAGH